MVDLGGITTGLIAGKETHDSSGTIKSLKIGIELIKPERIKDVLSKWKYFLLSVGNLIISSISDCKLPLDNKLYYIGNKDQGLMSSDKTKLVYHYKLVT